MQYRKAETTAAEKLGGLAVHGQSSKVNPLTIFILADQFSVQSSQSAKIF